MMDLIHYEILIKHKLLLCKLCHLDTCEVYMFYIWGFYEILIKTKYWVNCIVQACDKFMFISLKEQQTCRYISDEKKR